MKSLSIFSIRVYQLIKPYFDSLLLSTFGFHFECKQSPTCSQYTIQQIEKHGTIAGLKKGIIRVVSCR